MVTWSLVKAELRRVMKVSVSMSSMVLVCRESRVHTRELLVLVRMIINWSIRGEY